MESKGELVASIESAMRAKRMNREQLAEALGMNLFMVEKLLCGEIVPSTHLEKQLIKFLEIPGERIALRSAS